MEAKVQVNATGDVVTVLQGKALDPKYPEKISITGNILSVRNFLNKRYKGGIAGGGLQLVDMTRTVVVVNKESSSIALYLDPENPFGTDILAKLELSNELKKWDINGGGTFTREQLIKLIRFNRLDFADRDKHSLLLSSYQKMKISTAGDISQETDNRGNVGLVYNKTVNSESIPTEFILSIPIFKGFPAETFRVEICLDATNADVRFWFESVELKELIEIRKEDIFNEQLQDCEDFVIIHK